MTNYITIVIIDDDDDDFLLTKHYLDQIPNQKYQVKRASNYDEALSFFLKMKLMFFSGLQAGKVQRD